MATKRMKKTVAFFEVCDENELPMAPEDWQDQLAALLERQQVAGPLSLRHEIDDMRTYARVYVIDDERHLVMARERDEPPSSIDESNLEIVDEETQANRPWVEISILSFIPGTNIFGFVLGAMGSPRQNVLADWINEDGQMFAELVTVRPYVADSLVNMLQDGSSEARMVRLRLDAAQINGTEVDGAGLYSATQQLGRQLDMGPEVDVEVILRVRGRADSATEGTRRSIADRAKELIGKSFRGAQAEIVDLEPESTTDREIVDLVKHRMATKERISVMDDEGHQVRIPSAVAAISRAASRLDIKS